MHIEVFALAIALVTGCLALPISVYALIKVIAAEKSTHKIQYIDPLSHLSDEDMDAQMQEPHQGRDTYAGPKWDAPSKTDEDLESPNSRRGELLPPLID